MESRLESLLNRFETLISRAEQTQGSQQTPETGPSSPSKIARDYGNHVLCKVKDF